MSIPNHANIFTCTFCFHVSHGPPQIIGRSARLACTPCHAALLKLAICWVCGELVFRGDECVSFGWCFWHRACYGCLLYGSRAIYQGVRIQDLFRDEEEIERDGCGGKEVDKVPLCAAYVVEVEVDGVTEESTVVNRGLRRVEKVDGGLTRKRWEANNNERNSKSVSSWQPPIYRTGDGVTGDEGISSNFSSNSRDTSKSVIWVDIFDPINGPSFKPSPLKPIPLFMQRPASPIREPHRRVTAIDTHLQAPPYLRKPRSAPGSAYPRSLEESTISDHQSMRQRSPSPSVLDASRSPMPRREYGDRPSSPEVLKNCTKDDELSEVRHRQAVSWVREEPLKRPSSRLAPSRHSDLNRSEATTSAYRTPPEYPDQVLRTPYPLPLSTARTARPLPSQLTSHSQRSANTAPQSSEYLDRYQPMMARPAQNPEVRRLRRVAASLSEEGLARTRSEQSEGNNDWGTVGSELRRFFTGR
ncbi:hypothetical protein FPOAC2_10670 [Fusarium poae]|uniref:hypothetical protein n=1 Tax=Fusarium poae TaxID=36050 RepID=UPI001CEA4AFA|nr:hypothetical protein FPOAC1_010392 [Fusarium poae]KAG8665593.1 hypothetical protein FPOAC1_010392 [Fusarium poae]